MGSVIMITETRGNAAISWLPSPHHPYEDRFRLLSRDVPLVAQKDIGEIYAVFDGVGSAPKGMAAAQTMADCLVRFYTEPTVDLSNLLYDTNKVIHSLGFIEGSDRTLGACAGTVALIQGNEVTILHAGDTVGILLRSNKRPQVLTPLQEHGGAIYSYFGIGQVLEIEITRVHLEYDDLLLLLTDGVTKAFHVLDAGNMILDRYERTGSCATAITELVELSRRRGSSDDITVLGVVI